MTRQLPHEKGSWFKKWNQKYWLPEDVLGGMCPIPNVWTASKYALICLIKKLVEQFFFNFDFV
jgi:hypothetical protein